MKFTRQENHWAHLSFQAGGICVEGDRRGGFGFVFDQMEHRHAQLGSE